MDGLDLVRNVDWLNPLIIGFQHCFVLFLDLWLWLVEGLLEFLLKICHVVEELNLLCLDVTLECVKSLNLVNSRLLVSLNFGCHVCALLLLSRQLFLLRG